MQWGPPPPKARVRPPTPTTSRSGKRLSKQVDRLLVGMPTLRSDERDDSGVIAEVQVQVGMRDDPPCDLGAAQWAEIDDVEAGPLGSLMVVGQPLVIGVAGRAGLQEQGSRVGERGDQVDMAVGVPILEQALTEPDDVGCTEIVLQGALDLVPREGGVAVGVEETLLGRHEAPCRVDDHRPALEHERSPVDGIAVQLGENAARLLVTIPPGILAAPGVETEMYSGRAAPPGRHRR